MLIGLGVIPVEEDWDDTTKVGKIKRPVEPEPEPAPLVPLAPIEPLDEEIKPKADSWYDAYSKSSKDIE